MPSTNNERTSLADRFHRQELRVALVMNGGVSLAVWIGGVTNEINRLVRKESLYGKVCDTLLAVEPRVDVVSGTSAGGINGALLVLAMSQGKSLAPLRDIWLEKGDILTLLRKPASEDPPSLLDGGYFYHAMVQSFAAIAGQPGPGLQPVSRVPIELTLPTTVMRGEVRDFPDDLGTVIRDRTHRGLIQFQRGPDIPDDHFAHPDVARKLATAARATASFPGAFEPFYLPGPDNQGVTAGGERVGNLHGHTNFHLDCFVVDGGVLDNNPLESAIGAVFRQRAEREVRRVLAYVVPDPGYIPDPPPQRPDEIPPLAKTVLASLVSIPRVESISDQLLAIAEHNRTVADKRDNRILISQVLTWEVAENVAKQVFDGYRKQRARSAAEHIATALTTGAAGCVDATGNAIAIGRRRREQLAEQLARLDPVPWIPATLAYRRDEREWDWGLFTLENAALVLLDLLRRAVRLAPVQRSESSDDLWRRLREARRIAYDLVEELAPLRQRDRKHWKDRGTQRCQELVEGLDPDAERRLEDVVREEMVNWTRCFEGGQSTTEKPVYTKDIRPPAIFAVLADRIGQAFLDSAPIVRALLQTPPPRRDASRHAEFAQFAKFLLPEEVTSLATVWQRLLTLEVVQYTFGGNRAQDQFMELVLISANAPTAFDGPNRLEEKLAGVQVAHFGAFYKRSWRINDWMFGRLDGAERLMRILLDPARLARLHGWEQGDPRPPDEAIDTVLDCIHAIVMDGIRREDDRELLAAIWQEKLSAMRTELAFLAHPLRPIPEQLSECASMIVARLHLDILRQELPQLADAVGDDMLDGANTTGNGPRFLRRFERMLTISEMERPRTPGDIPKLAGELPAAQLVELFKEAKVGEEKLFDEFGTDRFTLTATRAAAVASSALAGKRSGMRLLRGAFATMRVPLLTLDILVGALLKRGRAMVGLYAMAMAFVSAILLSQVFAQAKWPGWMIGPAILILAAGLIVLLRRHPKSLIAVLAVLAGLWLWLMVRTN